MLEICLAFVQVQELNQVAEDYRLSQNNRATDDRSKDTAENYISFWKHHTNKTPEYFPAFETFLRARLARIVSWGHIVCSVRILFPVQGGRFIQPGGRALRAMDCLLSIKKSTKCCLRL